MATPSTAKHPALRPALIRWLSASFAGVFLWPLFPAWAVPPLEPPYPFSRLGLALTVGLGTVAYLIALSGRSDRQSALREFVFMVLAAASLGSVLRLTAESSENGYFTVASMSEALTALLALHHATLVMRDIASGDARTAVLSRLADGILVAIALLLIVFWIGVGMQAHFVAAPLLLVAAVASALNVLLLAVGILAGLTGSITVRPFSR